MSILDILFSDFYSRNKYDFYSDMILYNILSAAILYFLMFGCLSDILSSTFISVVLLTFIRSLPSVKGVDSSAVGLGSNPGKTILNGDRDTAIQI